MNKHLWSIFVGLAMAIVFVGTSTLYAAPKVMLKNNTINKSKTPGQKYNLPDLVVKNVWWSSNPKEGDTVGASSFLHITVLNQGTAAAGANKLRIECKSLTGTNYPYPLDGMIDIQPLEPGKSMTYAWPPSSSEKWFPGTYRMDFTADYAFNKVAESNETNNKKMLTFTVLAKSNLIKKIKAKPTAMPQLNTDLEIVSVTMTPDNPVSGQTVSVTAVVKNSGKVKTPEVDSIFSFWDTKGGSTFYTTSPSVPSLFPGQTYDLKTATSIITLGEHSAVEAKIDRFNKFKEINETNNAKIHYFNVQCKPELAPYDYTKTKPDSISGSTKQGEPFTTTIWVYNNGGCQSKPAVLAIQGTGLSFISYDIPPIMKNNKIGIPISLKWTEPGTKNCEIKVDYTNTNNESIENNNAMKLNVIVTADWPVQE
jgi:subtilase family serine protease